MTIIQTKLFRGLFLKEISLQITFVNNILFLLFEQKSNSIFLSEDKRNWNLQTCSISRTIKRQLYHSDVV
jgi:hypothetical protein